MAFVVLAACGGSRPAEPVGVTSVVGSATAPTGVASIDEGDVLPLSPVVASVYAKFDPKEAEAWWDSQRDSKIPPAPAEVTSGTTASGQGWAVVSFLPGCYNQGDTCDHYSSNVPAECVPRLKAGNDPTFRPWITDLETTGISENVVRDAIEHAFGGIRECLLEGYRVHPLDRGFINLRLTYYDYGCYENAIALGSALPDGKTRDCLRYEIGALRFRTGGHPIAFRVRVDYEAKRPSPAEEAAKGEAK